MSTTQLTMYYILWLLYCMHNIDIIWFIIVYIIYVVGVIDCYESGLQVASPKRIQQIKAQLLSREREMVRQEVEEKQQQQQQQQRAFLF